MRTAGRAESAYRRTVAEQDDHDVWIVLLAVNGISLDSSEPPQIQLDAVILPIDLACACAGDLQLWQCTVQLAGSGVARAV